jgi:hypothetical protein
MEDTFTVQIAEFAFPFPAEIFKTKMIDSGIGFREFFKDSYEGGAGSVIFYISNNDFQQALFLKNEVDAENIISEETHRHPIMKYVRWISLIGILSYLLYQLIDFLISITK